MRTHAIFLSAAFLALSGIAAHATGEIVDLITDADRQRLDDYDATKAEALDEARDDGAPAAEFEKVEAILTHEPTSFRDFDMVGDWQCRTIKIGGLAKLVIYDWFKCRVTDDGSGWRLEKLTGSQRTVGRFFDDGDARLIYLGSFFVADDEPPQYGAGPDSDQVGYAFRSDAAQWRIEFPAPRYESKLDILQFRR